MAFKEGDVVQLKSGGPDMTVVEIDEDIGCFCQWFDAKGNLTSSPFNAKALKIHEDDVKVVGFEVVN